MAQLAREPSVPSLAGLEEELSCSICLCLFESPVTTPCGHNFCLPCLEMTWGAARPGARFVCPQCRSAFDGRPELKKNTVLCRVVEQFRATQEADELGAPSAEVQPEAEPPPRPLDGCPSAVACDSCLEAAAAKTCLSCMASFCKQHLRPHLESPAFQGHQLVPPVKDLQQRKCPQHHKLLEFFCQEHAACICCLCLVSHKTCTTVPLHEAKQAKELQLKKRLTELYGLSEKAAQAVDQVVAYQKQNRDTVYRKLDLLKSEFLEIIALVQEEEKESVKKVTSEEKRVYDKYEFVTQVLCKKKGEIRKEKNEIELALTEDDDITFLTKTAKLHPVTFKDVFIPKIELNQNLIHTVYQHAFGLKESVKQFLTQPQEKKTEGSACLKPKLQAQSGKKNVASNASKEGNSSSMPSEKTTTEDATNASDTKQRRRPGKREPNPNLRARSCSTNRPEFQQEPLENFLKKPREQLLEFATKFSLDYNTAHSKVMLSERNTKISVSETPKNYPNHPQRFTYCFQVVSFQCFKRGIHYWEAEIEQSNFCAIGISYGSMPRGGPESRLGRNSSSWCIEWFNTRISAWHNDVEKRLPNTKVKKVGVLLNYDGGFVIFFGIAEKVTLLYKYRAQFTEAIYAAFWIFSSGTTVSLCQLNGRA